MKPIAPIFPRWSGIFLLALLYGQSRALALGAVSGDSGQEAKVGIKLNEQPIIWSSGKLSDRPLLDEKPNFVTSSTHTVVLADAKPGQKGVTKQIQISIGGTSGTVDVTNIDGGVTYEGPFDFQSLSTRGINDGTEEFFSIDSSMRALAGSKSSPDDSNQFDKIVSVTFESRGQARGAGVPIPKTPLLAPTLIPYVTGFSTVPPFSNRLLLSGGIEEIVFTYPSGNGDDKKSYFYRKNQADVMYYSGHGVFKEMVMGDLPITTIGDAWKEDLRVVIIAGCSLMSYRASLKGDVRSPASFLLRLGPNIYCGYGWYAQADPEAPLNVFSSAPFAPEDVQEGDNLFTANIIKKYLEKDPKLISASNWLLANDDVSSHDSTGAILIGRGKQSRNRNCYHAVGYEIKENRTATIYYWDSTDPNNPVFAVDTVTF
jgi:hypothetical protein